jgi:hypothetical protein
MATFTNRIVFIFTLCLALFHALPSSAIIVGFSAPTRTLNPGQHVTVNFTTSDTLDQNIQYYAAFGLQPIGEWFGPQLGEYEIGGYDLVTSGHSVTGVGSFGVLIKLPSYIVPEKTTPYALNTLVFGVVCTRRTGWS